MPNQIIQFPNIPASGAGISGTGSANQIAYWDSAQNITGNSNLTYNGSTITLGSTGVNVVLGIAGSPVTDTFNLNTLQLKGSATNTTVSVNRASSAGAISLGGDTGAGSGGELLLYGAGGSGGSEPSSIYLKQNGSNKISIFSANITLGDSTSLLTMNGAVKSIAANESTGGGTSLLGANCPAVTVTAPYTWIKAQTSDGSTVYFPVWK